MKEGTPTRIRALLAKSKSPDARLPNAGRRRPLLHGRGAGAVHEAAIPGLSAAKKRPKIAAKLGC